MTITTEQTQITLYYQEGSSDKVYQCSIEPEGTGFIVQFAYGRRGSTLNTGRKTSVPVPQEEARSIFNKLVRKKKAKGYTEGESGTPYLHAESGGRTTGIHPQLLNPVGEEQVEALLQDPNFWAQEKHDGKRMLLHKQGSVVCGINRKGLETGMPMAFRTAAKVLPGDFVMDGECVGESFHAFDLLQYEGLDLRQEAYQYRFLTLMNVVASANQRTIKLTETAHNREQKQRLLGRLQSEKKEGIVFKHKDTPYLAGRPASGGDQLKHKFHSTLSAVVSRVNRQRSVELELWDGHNWKGAGNVTVPPNHDLPATQSVIEVRYLYAFPESGCLFQPVYLGPRTDVALLECTTAQLKFKAPFSREEGAILE